MVVTLYCSVTKNLSIYLKYRNFLPHTETNMLANMDRQLLRQKLVKKSQ